MASTPLFTPLHFSFLVQPGVHAANNRINYVVPAGKIAQVTMCALSLIEPAGMAFNSASMKLFIIGPGTPGYSMVNIAVASFQSIAVPAFDLATGETFIIQTVQAAAGLAIYSANVEIREYL